MGSTTINGAAPQDTFYTYDGSGQRVRKVFTHMGTLKERIYLGGYEIYRERANTPGSTATFERQTLHVMDDQRRIAMVETKTIDTSPGATGIGVSRWRFQLDNHLGSATLEVDQAGDVIGYEEYHPYGSTAFHTASGAVDVSVKRYRYTGKERDEETGLYYHGARYYAPWLGRWTEADPAGMVDGLNLYRYSRDNPILFSDPGGTESKSFADPGSVDYQVGTRTDPQLIGHLRALTAQQRGDFLNGATGKFQTRVQAALAVAQLESVVAIPEDTLVGMAPSGDAPAEEVVAERPSAEELQDKVPLIPFFVRDYAGGFLWRQYVRADPGVPEGAPRGLRELRSLSAGAPLAVAQFSREHSPGTSVEELTLHTVSALGAGVSALSGAHKLAPALARGTLTVSDEALQFAAKSGNEAQKLRALTSTGEALADRGVNVVVRGEGVAAGELSISLKEGTQILAESKRLTQATVRAAQTAISKGTKQGGTLIVDATASGTTPETFDAAFETFKRVSLAQRLKNGDPGTSGQIIFLFGQNGTKVVRY